LHLQFYYIFFNIGATFKLKKTIKLQMQQNNKVFVLSVVFFPKNRPLKAFEEISNETFTNHQKTLLDLKGDK